MKERERRVRAKVTVLRTSLSLSLFIPALSLSLMKKSIADKIWKWFKIIFISYILIGAILYFIQDLLIFHPKKLTTDYKYSFDIPFRELNIAVNEEKNISIVQFTVPDSLRKGVVLYFHGNRQNINHYAHHANQFTKNGYEVWMMDYPGFGKSTGERSEKILYEDALLFYTLAIRHEPLERIIIYGKSLGTGIAAQLASKRECRNLVLETPYYSMDALARHYFFIFPVIPLSKYTLPTYEYLELTKAKSITILHGTRDAVIPYKHAKRLTAINPGTKLITVKGGHHNDLFEYPAVTSCIDSLLR
jgi:uncharacterized protein